MKYFWLNNRPLSWSQISSFRYSPSQWYAKYILGLSEPPNRAMVFGKEWGERIASDPSFCPQVPRGVQYEYKLEGDPFGIPLIGFIDSYTPHTTLLEYKTHGKNGWSKKRADEHGQLDLYCILLHHMHRVNPKDLEIKLVAVETQENNDFSITLADKPPAIFETKRTMSDLLKFSNGVKKTLDDMESYAQLRGKESVVV